MAVLDSLGKYRNTGILLLRVGLGIMMITHGFPKLAGGPAAWESIGANMKVMGIDFLPIVWGLAAGVAEAIGGLFLIMGLLFRPANLLLLFTMIIAIFVHFGKGDGLSGASHAIELSIVFFSLIFIGPGKYSIDKK